MAAVGGQGLTDVHAVIWAHGGSGGDIGRDGWAVTHQAWGSGTAGYNEGMVGMPREGSGLGTGYLGGQWGACCWPGSGGDSPAASLWPEANLREKPSCQGDIMKLQAFPNSSDGHVGRTCKMF